MKDMTTIPRRGHVQKIVERLTNYLTVIGFIGTLSVLVRFLSSTPYIRLSNTGIWGITIQGVPFLWIVSSLTLLNMRNFYNAIRGITQRDLTPLVVVLAGIVIGLAILITITR